MSKFGGFRMRLALCVVALSLFLAGLVGIGKGVDTFVSNHTDQDSAGAQPEHSPEQPFHQFEAHPIVASYFQQDSIAEQGNRVDRDLRFPNVRDLGWGLSGNNSRVADPAYSDQIGSWSKFESSETADLANRLEGRLAERPAQHEFQFRIEEFSRSELLSHAALGPVESMQRNEEGVIEIHVMGQSFAATGELGVTVGDYVVAASDVEGRLSGLIPLGEDYLVGVSKVGVFGQVSAVDTSAARFSIGEAVIDYSNALGYQPTFAVNTGEFVEVIGGQPAEKSVVLLGIHGSGIRTASLQGIHGSGIGSSFTQGIHGSGIATSITQGIHGSGIGSSLLQGIHGSGIGSSIIQGIHGSGIGSSITQGIHGSGIGSSLVQGIHGSGVGTSITQGIHGSGIGSSVVQGIHGSGIGSSILNGIHGSGIGTSITQGIHGSGIGSSISQ